MVILRKSSNLKCNLVSNGEQIKQVTKVRYLGYLITLEGRCTSEKSRRIAIVKYAFQKNETNTDKQQHKYENQNFVEKQKWKWAGHVARLKDNRWTLRVTEWQPRNGKRKRRRQARRWRDDIVKKKGNTWSRDARDRDEWRRDAEGYILQWMDRAS
ncbi:endonuclease-reverse transcriptase [Plakobranchus ocellatus]|uniref:Endonuclease-reverse transcriptase n=1 Tax=Plakobranchus ocellatus TaxID=259542 RepID=A0AAV4CN43_9GAST|nr:endonuclease-reverse transcriptase [Plakobranchus ocellatus]